MYTVSQVNGQTTTVVLMASKSASRKQKKSKDTDVFAFIKREVELCINRR